MTDVYMGRVLGWTKSDKELRIEANRLNLTEREVRRQAAIGTVAPKPVVTNLGAIDVALSAALREQRLSGPAFEAANAQTNASRPCHIGTTTLPNDEYDAAAIERLPHMPVALLNALQNRQFCYLGELFVAGEP